MQLAVALGAILACSRVEPQVWTHGMANVPVHILSGIPDCPHPTVLAVDNRGGHVP